MSAGKIFTRLMCTSWENDDKAIEKFRERGFLFTLRRYSWRNCLLFNRDAFPHFLRLIS